ncbi:MAG TPA: carboxypeptidase-like regulatory domain-containing protein, partial [Terriglobales bacterium]|nr:carboxypeptidase-like regulatory domain-containing protein [Terriglobales bacterium]
MPIIYYGMDKSSISSVFLLAALLCGSQARALPLYMEASGNAHGAGTVSGHAVRSDGANWEGPCHATLRKGIDRRGVPDPEQESPPDGKTSFSVPLDQRGNFQFANVQPGKHLLVVECPTASSVRELEVQANKQTRLDP